MRLPEIGRFHEISPRYHTREGAEKSREKRRRVYGFHREFSHFHTCFAHLDAPDFGRYLGLSVVTQLNYSTVQWGRLLQF